MKAHGNDKKRFVVSVQNLGGVVFDGRNQTAFTRKTFHNFSPRIGFGTRSATRADLVRARGYAFMSTRQNLNRSSTTSGERRAHKGLEEQPLDRLRCNHPSNRLYDRFWVPIFIIVNDHPALRYWLRSGYKLFLGESEFPHTLNTITTSNQKGSASRSSCSSATSAAQSSLNDDR